MMEVRKETTLPVLLSFLSGIFIISGGLSLFTTVFWSSVVPIVGGPWPIISVPYPYWVTIIMATISTSSGVLVLFASYKIYQQSEFWAVLVILGSLLSLFHGGTFGLGGILGLIGGTTTLVVKGKDEKDKKSRNIHAD